MNKAFLSLIAFLFVTFNSIGQSEIDIKNFTSGRTTTYRSNGAGKAQGLDFSIKYLNDWKKEEGDRPHVVQKFSKMRGSATIGYLILIHEIEGPEPTEDEIDS